MTAGVKYPIHKRSEAIRFIYDHIRIRLEFGRRQLTLQELCGTPQASQWIFYFMGKLTDYQPAHTLLREQLSFSAHLPVSLSIE
jgi:hypothetical protein